MPIRVPRPLVTLVVLIGFVGQACSLAGGAASQATSAPASPTAGPVVPSETVPPPTETAVPATPTVVHVMIPGDVPPDQYFLSDAISGGTNEIQRAQAGDNFNRNRLERPFDASSMSYRPDLDLGRVEISADTTWFYFTLIVYGSSDGSLDGPYGIEFDLDADGRGDLMVRGRPVAGSDWSTDSVQLWRDDDGDVGSTRPMDSDAPQSSLTGYETLVVDSGQGDDPDAAWVRFASIEDDGVQFAVKRSVVADEAFLWGAWADEGVNQPGWIDYNDHFTAAEAGSLETALAAVAAVDNTCRMYFGFTPSGSEPGLCVVTGTVRNCSPHPMRMEPGGRILNPFFEAGAILENVRIGTYTFYDQSVEGNPVVLTATLTPGGLITITKTGFGDSYPCQ